ncbi:hypothetical protein BS78_01G071600 [Paspalum vaginatum]|nr:hypothetical protein BS78_01G071600 [Paspalum vaginatum]
MAETRETALRPRRPAGPALLSSAWMSRMAGAAAQRGSDERRRRRRRGGRRQGEDGAGTTRQGGPDRRRRGEAAPGEGRLQPVDGETGRRRGWCAREAAAHSPALARVACTMRPRSPTRRRWKAGEGRAPARWGRARGQRWRPGGAKDEACRGRSWSAPGEGSGGAEGEATEGRRGGDGRGAAAGVEMS